MGSPPSTRPSWGDRAKWLGVPVGLALFGGWFASLLIWPVYAGIATLVALFAGTIYLALFVWPFQKDDLGDF